MINLEIHSTLYLDIETLRETRHARDTVKFVPLPTFRVLLDILLVKVFTLLFRKNDEYIVFFKLAYLKICRNNREPLLPLSLSLSPLSDM